MIRVIFDWFLWGTGVFFWTIALGGLIGSGVAELVKAAQARRKERAR